MEITRKYSSNYGAVILLDALGTKGTWQNNDPEKSIEKWNIVIDSMMYDKEIASRRGLTLTHNAFSDTLVITITGSNDRIKILNETSGMMHQLLDYGIRNEIYFRGAVSIGFIYSSIKKNTYQ